jgi:hypothetical protein
LHAVPPVKLWYVPAAHRSQKETWVLGLYVPAAHWEQTALLIGLQVPPHELPARHTWHDAHTLPPAPLWNLPASHPAQLRLALADAYLPATHWLQTRFVVAVQAVVWYWPAAHTVHPSHWLLPDPVWYTPAPQSSHSYRPVIDRNLPAAHRVHVPLANPLQPDTQYPPVPQLAQASHPDLPDPVWYTPARVPQASHPGLPDPVWYVPARQKSQAVLALPVWYLPVPHRSQADFCTPDWYSPCLHTSHWLPLPEYGPIVPAAQTLQNVVPERAWLLP